MKRYIVSALCALALLTSCAEDFLRENPVNDIYADNLLSTYDGFESMNYAMLAMVRGEYDRMDVGYGGTSFKSLPFAKSVVWSCGCDNAFGNNRHTDFRFFSYPKNITAMTSQETFLALFEWLYKVVNTANMVIERAEKNDHIDWQGGSEAANEANRATVIAEAKLYRAWAYRHLTYSFGAVPLSTQEISGSNYRTDWERNPVSEIRALMVSDLKYAVENLPMRVNGNNTKPNQAVARHFLGETYLAMDKPDSALLVLQPLCEGKEYSLMTSRFGSNAANPGSAFIDVFRSPLFSDGNKEVLWAFVNTEEENVAYGNTTRCFMRNMWTNYYTNCTNPNAAQLNCNLYPAQSTELFWSLNGGKGAGRCAICIGGFKLYEFDNQQNNDVRYDENSMRWHIYFMDNNGAKYEVPGFIHITLTPEMQNDTDPTIKNYNLPSTRKWEYVNPVFSKSSDDNQFNDMVYMRLAETYLLYAEALMKVNRTADAAEWINKIRRRAHVSDIAAGQVSIDFILDERSRELITEEHRRETLIRLSQENGGDERLASNIFKTRVRTHNEVTGRESRGMADDVTPVLFPLPQEFIDSNSGRTIAQNPGY